MSAAGKYRQSIRSLESLKQFQFSSDDRDFYEYLEFQYKQAKQAKSNGDLFLIGVGLFAFGRLDVAEDILDNIPAKNCPISVLAGVLRLLPLPRNLLSWHDRPDAIREWLRVKSPRLNWSESKERYILENFKILSSIPPGSEPKYFAVSESQSDRDRLVVEIFPDIGNNWIATFHAGRTKFSGVYQHPNRVDLALVSNGQGYIVNPETQQLLETFGGEIVETIECFDSYVLLFQDPAGFTSYAENGLLWRNSELLWSGTRYLKVDSSALIVLIGEYQRSPESIWEPFWINVKTGEVRFEKYDWLNDALKRINSHEMPWWKIWLKGFFAGGPS